jgi:CheY-like chemotaxis protein
VRLPLPNGVEAGLRMQTPVSSAAAGMVRSVLLIEDEMTLRTTISRFLRGQGYTVDLSSNGRAALELLQQRRYDVILLDLRMSGMTGEEVYQTIEAAYPEQASKVLFMTGDLHSEAAARFIRATRRPVLAKPFTLADLTARLVDVIA